MAQLAWNNVVITCQVTYMQSYFRSATKFVTVYGLSGGMIFVGFGWFVHTRTISSKMLLNCLTVICIYRNCASNRTPEYEEGLLYLRI